MSTEPVQSSTGEAQLRATIWHVGAGLVVAFVASIATTTVWATFFEADGDGVTLGRVIASMVGLWAAFLGVPWWVSKRYGTGSVRRDFNVSFRWPDVPTGIAVGLACQFVVVWLVYLPIRVLRPEVLEDLSEPAEQLTGLATGLGVVFLFFAVVLIGPFAEELFFRGLALKAFSRGFGVPAGVITSGLLFGLFHFRPLQAPALIVLGIILAVMVNRADRLGPAVISHMAFNAVTYVGLVLLL